MYLLKYMPLARYSPGFSYLDCPILDGDLSNGSLQTSYSDSNDLVCLPLGTDTRSSNRKLRSSSCYVYERRETKSIRSSQVGQTTIKVICQTIDEDFVSTLGTVRIQSSRKTVGQRISLESRGTEPKQFSLRHTTVTQLVTHNASPATD